jgi:PPM family protein phosphatase
MPDDGEAFSSPAGLDVGQATDVGRVREANEDALLTLARAAGADDCVLVAVADGMGGHKAGEVASALAIEALRTALSGAESTTKTDRLLIGAVEQANRDIWNAAAEDREKEGMGTTLVCALVSGAGAVAIANVGDSRAYLVGEGAARLVTVDHTWVNQQVIDGQLTESEARISPYRNLLTRSLGSMSRVDVDVFGDLTLGSGDALVLVSDGVSGYLDEGDVAAIVRQSASAQEAAEQLVGEAIERGGADNATAVVVRRTPA